MKLFRHLLLLTFFASSVAANAVTIKIATLSPDGSAWMREMKAAAKEVSEKTDNRVRFRFYPGGVMGNDTAVLKKIRIGQLHGAAFSGGALAHKVPDTQIYNLPFLFNSFEEVDYVRSKMDKKIEDDFTKAGFVNFGLAEGGFGYIMSKQDLTDPNELKNSKVWVPAEDPASESAAETFGFAPTPLSIGDVLTGLQTDLINTVTASPVAAIALQWHTQLSHVTDLPLIYFYGIMAIDKKAFKRIKAEDQPIVTEIMRKYWKKIDKLNRDDAASAITALKDQGIKVLKPTAEQVNVWKSKTDMATKLFVEKGDISDSYLAEIRQHLKDFRQQQNAQ